MSDSLSALNRQDPLPSLAEFQMKTGVVERVKELNKFSFLVEYQKNSAISDARDILARQGYAVLNDLLESSGIHYLHELEVQLPDSTNGKDGILLGFRFSHDRHHCKFQIRDNRFEILRSSCSFSDFYSWYAVVMPEALRIEMTLRQIVQTATKSILTPVRSQYEFVFNFSNFRRRIEDPSETRPPRNMDVLKSFIPHIPVGRTITDLAEQDLYRLDLTISRRETFGDKARNTWVVVEAPFNENGRFIVLTAQLRNIAAEVLEEGSVAHTTGFDADYGSDYRIALLDFLRDRVLEGFAWRLFNAWDFDTERQL
ncbi:hypothetical protein [Streptomyces sp. NBC_00271]|uniref:hypothetical protein n=1 Tax=Streptomyces sp. NBC_00271 TaxID=2975697 RepID=UPI002E2D50F1|nr:hypothetical protein [Streptomyces sp. NBC_00271]